MSEHKVILSERWTKIARVLPESFLSSLIGNNDLYVEPSGFRRVIKESLQTCEDFNAMLFKIEECLEKRIPGIASYYHLTHLEKNEGSIMTITSGATYMDSTSTSSATSGRVYAPFATQKKEGTTSIFERAGESILYKGRKLTPEEMISFHTAMNLFRRTTTLKEQVNNCCSVLGSLSIVLERGKVFQKRSKTIYFGERALETFHENSDVLPLFPYWTVLSHTYLMKELLSRMSKELPDE